MPNSLNKYTKEDDTLLMGGVSEEMYIHHYMQEKSP